MSMKWSSHIVEPGGIGNTSEEFTKALAELAELVKSDMEGLSVNLLVLFVSSQFKEFYGDVLPTLKEIINADIVFGCSAGGLIGGGIEIEHKPSISITAAHLPDVDIKYFHLEDGNLPDLDEPQESWEKIVDSKADSKPSFILIPDPFTFNTDTLVRGLDFAFPESVKIGGLASGAMAEGENALFLNEKVYSDGLIGLSISGNIEVDAVVAQGCKPVGETFTITKCNRNILFELDGEPAVMALKSVIDSLSERDKELIKDSVFLGILTDEMKESHGAGDFLIRNILGIEPKSGALMVGEILNSQKTVQFHVRDAATSTDDLRLLLKQYKDRAGDEGKSPVSGALLFSCLGRGAHLYGRENHDSDLFRSYLGQVPIGGFFCNGEIGPIGSNTFLHGYTSSFGIFRSP